MQIFTALIKFTGERSELGFPTQCVDMIKGHNLSLFVHLRTRVIKRDNELLLINASCFI